MGFILFLAMSAAMLALVVVKVLKITAVCIWVKGLASLFFIATGIASYQKMKKNKRYFIFILSGLLFSFSGDVLLELSGVIPDLFIIGVGSFAICHIMYSIGFCTLKRVMLRDVVICLVIAAPLVLLQILGSFNFGGMKFIVMGYTVLISFMVSKAISLHCYYRGNEKAVIMTIAGAVMFLISDILLLFWLFSTPQYGMFESLNILSYYLGQGILSLSLGKKLEINKSKTTDMVNFIGVKPMM